MQPNFETLVFCTSHIAGRGEWVGRYERWLNHHAALPFERAIFCMIDDLSPYRPDQVKVQTSRPPAAPRAADATLDGSLRQKAGTFGRGPVSGVVAQFPVFRPRGPESSLQ
jgi:hypothetical protein